MSSPTALVFGGAGYIGSHACKELKASGYSPVVFDNLTEGHREFVKWGPLIEADIRDKAAVEKAFADVKPDVVIHFAAYAYVGESVENPAKYYENNVLGTLNIACAARDAGNVPIVFSSSCATYGIPDAAFLTEDTPQHPINPYGRTKHICEQIFTDFDQAHGLTSVCLRYFNACGGDADGEVGESHRIETHLIPRAILAALGQIDDFKVFGHDYPTPDGSAVRDYVHVTDLARAHVLACDFALKEGRSEKINLGTGTGISVLEIVEAVGRITGKDVPHSISDRRAGDPPELVADASKAREVLKFEAQHSDLDNIISTAVRWHEKHG